MTRNIVLCDDEPEILDSLEHILKRIETSTQEKYVITKYLSGEELLANFPENTDLLFLDIRMGELNGMQVARKLREKYESLYLIFLTSLVEYALEGYDVHAFAFLTKPVKEETVKRQMIEIFNRMDEEKEAKITLRAGNVRDIIEIKDIIYLEVYKHDTILVSKEGRNEYTVSLNSMEEQLTRWGFFRCHKSYLVNLKQIERIESVSLVMRNGESVPLSKHRRKEFLALYARKMGECM